MKNLLSIVIIALISVSCYCQDAKAQLEAANYKMNHITTQIDSLHRVQANLKVKIDSLKLASFNYSDIYTVKWSFANIKAGIKGVVLKVEGDMSYINTPDCQNCKIPSHYLRNETQYQANLKKEAEEKQKEEQARKLRQDSIMKIFQEKQAIREQEEAKEKAAQLAQRKKDLIKKYGEATTTKILDGKIWIGMTKEMAVESWGSPKDINRTAGSWGVLEQWVYENYYLYFENGKLTSWQD